MSDTTGSKQAEEERELLLVRIREQARQMEQILATVPEGVLLLDAEGRVLQANPTAEKDLAVLAGAKMGDILTRLGDRPLAELLTSPPKGLWHEVKADKRTFEVIARSMGDGPEPEYWVLVVNDVTQERGIRAQLQQQEQLASMGQLASGIAHDFNNLLTSIILYAQILRNKPHLPPDLTPAADGILSESRRAAGLVQQILDFGRRAMIETRPVDLASSAEKTVDILRRTLPENIQLTLDAEAEECIIKADPARIQQVLMNLAINARDAMPEGGELRFGLSKVTVEEEDIPPIAEMSPVWTPGEEWVCLTTSDTGTGMTDQVLSHLFEPFFTTKPVGQGTGLGLAQVHGIVKQHRGYIGVETEVGRGTTFRIYFPAHGEKVKEGIEEISPTPKGKGETILLVEDEDKLREVGQEILESLGYHVLVAANGQEALELYGSAEEVDLVVTDLVMPQMGGRTLIRELGKATPEIKVLAITGHAIQEDIQTLEEAGFLDVVQKPFDTETLARAVRQALDGK